jgi:uncharacterized protein
VSILRTSIDGNHKVGCDWPRWRWKINLYSHTDRVATDETADIKAKTTVAFDFGRLQIAPDCVLQIYGTPGQERFDFMWDMLIEQANAFILLVAAHRPHEFRYARRIAQFMQQRRQLPMIVGITHSDHAEAWSEANIALALGYRQGTVMPPIVAVNPHEFESTAQAVMTAMHYLFETASLESANQTAAATL